MVEILSKEIYVGLLLVASASVFTIGAWLWSDERGLTGKLFVGWAVLHAILGLIVVGHVLAPTLAVARYFYIVGAAVGFAVPPTVFLFTLTYIGRARRLSRYVVGTLVAWYVGISLLVLTDPILGLAYTEYVTVSTPFTYVYGMPTTLFSLASFPLWFFVVAGPAWLGARALSDSGVTRAQTLSLFVAFLIPFVVLALWFANSLPGPPNGAMVIGALPTSALIAWAVHRYQLFDLVPLSREMVFDELNDAVLVLDRDLRLLDYNHVAVEMFPDLEDDVGTNIDEVVPALASGGEADTIGSFPASFTSYRDSEPRVYSVSASRLPEEETFRGHGLVIRDVTGRNRRVRDLEQQTKQLERFASTLSHDIRNPLSVVQGQITLAQEDEGFDGLEKAVDAVGRIEQIVDDLLTLSREGRTIDERQFVSLATVAEDAWEMTETEDATLDIAIDPAVGVYADETRLGNVFENLFRNALEFGGRDVTVRLGRHTDGFFVEDDGPGIPPGRRDRVLDYEYTTTENGTGLGLAIVDSIAQAHGWSVSVTDGSIGGARFVFSDVDVVTSPSSSPTPTEASERTTHLE